MTIKYFCLKRKKNETKFSLPLSHTSHCKYKKNLYNWLHDHKRRSIRMIHKVYA